MNLKIDLREEVERSMFNIQKDDSKFNTVPKTRNINLLGENRSQEKSKPRHELLNVHKVPDVRSLKFLNSSTEPRSAVSCFDIETSADARK